MAENARRGGSSTESRGAEAALQKNRLVNSPWIEGVLSTATSRINYVSPVLTDPEIFRNDTSPLRYFTARRPALAHFRRAPRIDRYPGRLPRATIHERVSRLALPFLGCAAPGPSRPPAPWEDKKTSRASRCCTIAPAMASSSAPARKPLAELTEDEFLTDLVCFSTRIARRMSFPSPRRLARAPPVA